jgi:hypothetical protein
MPMLRIRQNRNCSDSSFHSRSHGGCSLGLNQQSLSNTRSLQPNRDKLRAVRLDTGEADMTLSMGERREELDVNVDRVRGNMQSWVPDEPYRPEVQPEKKPCLCSSAQHHLHLHLLRFSSSLDGRHV